jgi:hypothetical protein
MKSITTIILFFVLTILGCKKEETKIVNQEFDSKNATVIAQGNFSSNAHTTSGKAILYTKDNKKWLVFENFKTDNGPDLRIYLSTSTNNSSFKDLGKLKSVSGNFNYEIDNTINTNENKYVLVWCEDFSVLFGNTLLQ